MTESLIKLHLVKQTSRQSRRIYVAVNKERYLRGLTETKPGRVPPIYHSFNSTSVHTSVCVCEPVPDPAEAATIETISSQTVTHSGSVAVRKSIIDGQVGMIGRRCLKDPSGRWD